jgi:hypothetical protein
MQKLACIFFLLAIGIGMTKGISDVTEFSLTVSAFLAGISSLLLLLMLDEDDKASEQALTLQRVRWYKEHLQRKQQNKLV